jgi:hypothetical protein
MEFNERKVCIGYPISAETRTILELCRNFLPNMFSVATIHADVCVSSQDGRDLTACSDKSTLMVRGVSHPRMLFI